MSFTEIFLRLIILVIITTSLAVSKYTKVSFYTTVATFLLMIVNYFCTYISKDNPNKYRFNIMKTLIVIM